MRFRRIFEKAVTTLALLRIGDLRPTIFLRGDLFTSSFFLELMGAGQKQVGIHTARPLVVMITSAAQIWISPGMANQEGQNLILLLSVPRKAIISPVPENSFAEIVSLLSLRHFQSF